MWWVTKAGERKFFAPCVCVQADDSHVTRGAFLHGLKESWAARVAKRPGKQKGNGCGWRRIGVVLSRNVGADGQPSSITQPHQSFWMAILDQLRNAWEA